jgi:signal peptidase I
MSSTAERIKARAAKREEDEAKSGPPANKRQVPFWHAILLSLRGWADALVFAYLLAMFIRIFVFELFMIPTGSMTPTLIGDADRRVAFADYNSDGIEDVWVRTPSRDRILVYVMGADGFPKESLFIQNVPASFSEKLFATSTGRTDMILVNKFAYWFGEPQRGDIIVFKVPDHPDRVNNPFDPYKPIFIKRCVGLPGEEVTLRPPAIDRVPFGAPNFTGTSLPKGLGVWEMKLSGKPVIVDGVELGPNDPVEKVIHFPYGWGEQSHGVQTVVAGDDEVLMFGDHQHSSSDSRDWGPVPIKNLRGRAVMRYWPFKAFKILR